MYIKLVLSIQKEGNFLYYIPVIHAKVLADSLNLGR